MGIWASEPDKLALVLTDANGTILFANRVTLSIVHRITPGDLIGRRLHEIFGIEPERTESILKDIRRLGTVSNQELVVHDVDNAPKSVLYSGTAAFDGRENFLGVDIRMRKLNTVRDEKDDTRPVVNYDVKSQENAAQYFQAQFSALRALLSDVGGDVLVQHLESVVNETAERNSWAFSLSDPQAHINSLAPEVYFGLLGRAMNYSINVIGRGMVEQRIRSVDAKLPDNVRQTAQSNGFYQLLFS